MTKILFVLGIYFAVVVWIWVYLGLARGMNPVEAFKKASGAPLAAAGMAHLMEWLGRWLGKWWRARQDEQNETVPAQGSAGKTAEPPSKGVETLLVSSIRSEEQLPRGYIVRSSDRIRDNGIDPWIKQRYRALVYDVFGNRCFSCGSCENITLDHLWWPKSKGGNFAMRHENGLVANVVPMCRSCNSSKGDSAAITYFSEESYELLIDGSERLTERFRSDADLVERVS